MQLQIDNEFDKLEAVLVHRPGREIDRLTHDDMREFLFEDIPYLRRMQDEHDAFVAKMRGSGIEVLYLEDLLPDVLADEAVRERLVRRVCQIANVPAIADTLINLSVWNVQELLDILFAGLTAGEFREAAGGGLALAGADTEYLLPPIPNAYFSRDPAVVVRDAAISCKMHYRQRIRETLLIRCVLENHAEFRGNPITYGGTAEPTEDRPFTIEGGDVIILSDKAVLIGASQRTRSETIELLAGKCFRFGQVERVYEIPIPIERAFMHLDTVFTIVDRGKVLWFSEVMEKVTQVMRFEAATGENGIEAHRVAENRTFLDVLGDEFGCEVTVIDTAGGGKHFAKREQRTDGANALAIAPGVVITYARNERTTQALRAAGVTCLEIEDSELVRGLGGPRCMTMPLRRATS